MISDEDLMISAAWGDTSAFEQIVRRYQTPVWRVACRFTGNSADAQDISQTVFLKLFEAAPRYRPSALLKTYLFRIVNTTCIDYSRKIRPMALNDAFDVPDNSPSVVDALIMRERDEMIRRAIETLPGRQRSAIVLRYEAGLSVCDIAQIMKATEKAVERLLAHARDSLSAVIRKNQLQ